MRNTLILVVLALGLGSFVYLTELRDPEGREEAERAAKRLVQIDEESVSEIRLALSGGGSALLKREGEEADGWRLHEPVEYAGDETGVGAVLVALADLESQSDFEASEEELDHYGLGAEAARVEATSDSGERFALRLGEDTPLGGNAYALLESEPNQVHAVPAHRRRALQPELSALRDKRVLMLEPETLRGVQVERAGRLIGIVERPGGQEDAAEGVWRMVAPVEDRADDARVARLVSDLSLLRASDFIDQPEAPATYGLERPLIKLALGAGDTAESLLLGKVDADVYARRAGSDLVFEIPDRILEQVPKTAFELRYKQVLAVAGDTVRALTIEFPESQQRHRFQKLDDGWSAADAELRVDPDSIVELVEAFEWIEATGIEAGEPDLAALGLNPPQVRITLFGEESAELARLELGTLELGRGIPARANQQARVWRVINDLGEDIPLNAEAFANRWIEAEPSEESGSDDLEQ